MSVRAEFQALRNLGAGDPASVLVDIGTSSLTGIRASALPSYEKGPIAHPVMQTLPLKGLDCAALGSDCVRTGLLFERPFLHDDTFVDAFGIEWLVVDGMPTPSRHPLEEASLSEIAKYPRPAWPQLVQLPEDEVDDLIVVADAPCPGLLDMCFGLRNTWVCLDDMTSNWRNISALLDWSLESIEAAYDRMLSSLPKQPDIVVYGDDLGFQQSMFISEIDFRNFVRPRMRTLFSRLRRMTSAALCFHSCGAIRPIMRDIADLGIDLFNFDGNARGMVCSEVRQELPRAVIIHGSSDLVALGRSVRERNMASVAVLATEIVDSMPVIAAPMDNITLSADVEFARLGAEFLRQLTPHDIADLARFGPVRNILENAVRSANEMPAPELSGLAPSPVDISQLAVTSASAAWAGSTPVTHSSSLHTAKTRRKA